MNNNRGSVTNRSSRGKRWLKRIVVIVPIFVVIVVGGLLAYGALAEAATWRNYPAPGRIVDVGGYQLHLHVMGEPQGQPTIILEHGGASMSAQWGWVQPELARHARVVAYDRPGLGWSEAAPGTLDAQRAVDQLYRALQAEGIEGPYLLVGHSLGALMTRLFAQRYPDEVVGMVLVDPRNVAQHELLPFQIEATTLRMVQIFSRLGILRLTGMAERETAALPSPQREAASHIYLSTRQVSGWAADGALGESAIAYLQQNEAATLPPLIVLDATEPGEGFDAAQRTVLTGQYHALVERSQAGVYRAVGGAGHGSIVTDPRHAQVISASVLELLQQP